MEYMFIIVALIILIDWVALEAKLTILIVGGVVLFTLATLVTSGIKYLIGGF